MIKLKVGIVGLGNIGYYHASNIYSGKVNNMTLVAVCDNNAQKMQKAKDELKDVIYFESFDEMIKSGEIEAVIIAVPHYLHTVFAIKAFEQNLHVITEKPAGVAISQVKLMNEAARKSGKVFGIMFNQRVNPLFKKAKELIESGTLGNIKNTIWIITNWYRTQYYYDSGDWRATWSGEGGGVLINQAPHNLDMLQYLVGLPDFVYADLSFGQYHNIDVEDEARLFFSYNSGAKATFITSTSEPVGTNRLEITGTLGKIVLENNKLKLWSFKQNERDFCFESLKNSGSIGFEFKEFETLEEDLEHCGILINFADCVLSNVPLIASGFEGENQVRMTNASLISAVKGEKIALDFKEEEFDIILKLKCENEIKREKLSKDKKDKVSSKERWQVNW